MCSAQVNRRYVNQDKNFTRQTPKLQKRMDIVDITKEVSNIVSESNIKEGICNIYTPHATAAITINENADPNVGVDIQNALQQLVPEGKWLHDRVDGNADAHIKASIIGSSESIPIKDGELLLGTWQDIFLCCFDGPRNRKIIITIIGE